MLSKTTKKIGVLLSFTFSLPCGAVGVSHGSHEAIHHVTEHVEVAHSGAPGLAEGLHMGTTKTKEGPDDLHLIPGDPGGLPDPAGGGIPIVGNK